MEKKFNLVNDGRPDTINREDGYLFTVTPSTAKTGRGYFTKELVPLTVFEKKMPGVVVGQNRGMLFSSARKIKRSYAVPSLREMNIIIVDEISRKLTPVEDKNNKIAWKGNGERTIKDVCADGQGQHWLCTVDGALAANLWLKVGHFGYGCKGMLQPGLAVDVGSKVIDHWHVERTITLGNTLLVNSSMIKGLNAYDSLEDFISHSEEWNLTEMLCQWQSGDHKPQTRRIMGTQPNSTNMQLKYQEIEELLKPEARKIWLSSHEEIAWRNTANINTCRGRAIAARPSLMYSSLIMHQVDSKAGNNFRRIANGKFMAEGQYLKMYMDKLVYSYVYVHGMDYNEAARKASETGLHGEIRVNPSFAGRYYRKDENGISRVAYRKNVQYDEKGRPYVESALVRYPHGAPSETIVVKLYLDDTIPTDVIVFPAPVADENGNVQVSTMYAFRLQGADFDGDAVTAYTEPLWLEAQKRNIGRSYMVIPVNTDGTEKDKTLVTDDTFREFFEQKISGLSNRVGLIATSLKYFLAQWAWKMRDDIDVDIAIDTITDHACAMGDDIDEFKHGKSTFELDTFVVESPDGLEYLRSPYFNRYAHKYDAEKFEKVNKTKKPGNGTLDLFAAATENLMAKCKLHIVEDTDKASDGTERHFYTVHPVTWNSRDVDLFKAGKGCGQVGVSLPSDLEELYDLKHGTILTAKDLFRTIYRSYAAVCRKVLADEDRDTLIKAMSRLNRQYILAKVTVIAWTKVMMKKKTGEDITAQEALKIFTTLMIQHTKGSRSAIETMTRVGTFQMSDGTIYQKTVMDASRAFNFFLDICGDGLLFLGMETPDFPKVSDEVLKAANLDVPDLAKAEELALMDLAEIEALVDELDFGINAVIEDIDDGFTPPSEEDLDASVLDGDLGVFCCEDFEELGY